MSIDAMKQALEALERGETKLRYEAITALRAAIEQTNDWDEVEALRESLREHMAEIHRLRQWQGLTADEIWDEWCKQTKPERDTRNFVAAFALAIEAKLKEKNT